VGGYSFLSTPTIVPGVDASPIITWGTIEGMITIAFTFFFFFCPASDALAGTPLLLDPLATPLQPEAGKGPTFKIPETPRRDQIAMELADKASFKVSLIFSSTSTLDPLYPTAAASVRTLCTDMRSTHFVFS
jgi:protein DGCR14